MAKSFRHNKTVRGVNRQKQVPLPEGPFRVTIKHVGASGDGIAYTDDNKPLYVPYVLAGECWDVVPVKVRGKGFLAKANELVGDGSLDRVEPVCKHFTECGGCALQHMSHHAYADYKKQQIVDVLSQHGFKDAFVNDAVILGAGQRRRTTLKFDVRKNSAYLGYYAKASHQLVTVQECPVLHPSLDALISPLKDTFLNMKSLLGDSFKGSVQGDVMLTVVQGGVDVRIITPLDALDLPVRELWTDFCRSHKIVRLTFQLNDFDDPVYQSEVPTVLFDNVAVPVSSGCFLQASEKADVTLASMVTDALSDCGAHVKTVVDLFCGRGTLTLPLSQHYQVTGVEADSAALDALSGVAKVAKRPVKTELRNLFTDPMSASDLNDFSAIVLDPPRAGAAAQIEHIAASTVPYVVYVSCNPASFAQDAHTLTSAGYMLKSITPVDQFMWSSHVEVVAVFHKG